MTYDSERDNDNWDDVYDDEPRPVLTLSAPQRTALAVAVDNGLREQGCDSTLRHARRFAEQSGLGWSVLREQLEGNGGYCDCEVLLNVVFDEPEADDDS